MPVRRALALEVHLLPNRHPRPRCAHDDERAELAGPYRRLLRALDGLDDTPTPYIAAWHQAPVERLGRGDPAPGCRSRRRAAAATS